MISIEEMLDCIITKIGLLDCGRARWFCKDPSREVFTDKVNDKEINRDELLDEVFKSLNKFADEWIPVDDLPDEDDEYLVAWLPRCVERAEAFVAILTFQDGEWEIPHEDMTLLAYRPIPRFEVV